MVDQAKVTIGAPLERDGTALDGRGVILGLIDSGFDQEHPSLKSAVLASWDQFQEPIRPDVFDWPLSFDPRRSVLRDLVGHGTHLAGIAAGRSDPVGVASGADLVLVHYRGTEADLLDGVEFIFDVAERHQKPAVINISQGGNHGDPHDGSDLLCQGIDEMTGPGRLVCCAAGNEERADLHVRIALHPGHSVSIPFVTLSSEVPHELWTSTMRA